MPCILVLLALLIELLTTSRARTHLFDVLHSTRWRQAKAPDPALFRDGSFKVLGCGYAPVGSPAALGQVSSPVAYETLHH